MSTLEDRLSDLLTSAADRIEVTPDLDSVIHSDRVTLRVEASSRWRRPTSVALAVAAAAALVVSGLVVVASIRDTTPVSPASVSPNDEAASPELFPVFDRLPSWAGEIFGSYRTPDIAPPPRAVYALVARLSDNGALLDPIIVSVQEERPDGALGGGARINVGDMPATVLRDPLDTARRTVVLDGTPTVGATGRVDQALLAQVLSGVNVHNPAGEFTAAINTVPAGFHVVVPPTPQSTSVLGAAASSTDSSLDVAVDGALPDPRLRTAFAGDITPVRIDDVTGWYAQVPTGNAATAYVIAWEPNPGTILVLSITHQGLTANQAIDIARGVRLTTETEWRDTYGVEDNPLPEDPNTPTTGPTNTETDRTLVMDGTSMVETFHDGDELRFVPVAGAIDRGDIVVAELGGPTTRTMVKRVIAFGGETIETHNCVVMIDGTAIEEPYLDPQTVRPGNCGGDLAPTTVPDGMVFVIGDNRGGSQDSRALGPIPLDTIAGIVVAAREPGGDWTPVGS